MAHTQNAVICGPDGVVHMVVIPDDDHELDDPAFNPKGLVHIRVDIKDGVDPTVLAAQVRPDLNIQVLDISAASVALPVDDAAVVPIDDNKPSADTFPK